MKTTSKTALFITGSLALIWLLLHLGGQEMYLLEPDGVTAFVFRIAGHFFGICALVALAWSLTLLFQDGVAHWKNINQPAQNIPANLIEHSVKGKQKAEEVRAGAGEVGQTLGQMLARDAEITQDIIDRLAWSIGKLLRVVQEFAGIREAANNQAADIGNLMDLIEAGRLHYAAGRVADPHLAHIIEIATQHPEHLEATKNLLDRMAGIYSLQSAQFLTLERALLSEIGHNKTMLSRLLAYKEAKTYIEPLVEGQRALERAETMLMVDDRLNRLNRRADRAVTLFLEP